MTGQFLMTLLNPGVSLMFAATFAVLWCKRRDASYLWMLAIAFLSNGIAFAANDFLSAWEGPALRIVVNVSFYVAVILASLSALLRLNIVVPVRALTALTLINAVLFGWFLFVMPSTEARVYVNNGVFVIISATTAWLLVKARPRTPLDWTFVAFTVLMFMASAARPIATAMNQLNVNEGGPFRNSDYWATVIALTPILAILLTLIFLAALASQMVNELRQEAHRDYLSGLLNRRGFEKAIDALGQNRADTASAVVVADIDDFKAINDTFGHATGDMVVKWIADALAELAEADAVGRTGGDEFSLYYRGRSIADIRDRAERVRRQLQDPNVLGMPVTLSIGVHVRHADETLSEMMARADAALYRAKHDGKDRVVVAPVALHAASDLPAERSA